MEIWFWREFCKKVAMGYKFTQSLCLPVPISFCPPLGWKGVRAKLFGSINAGKKGLRQSHSGHLREVIRLNVVQGRTLGQASYMPCSSNPDFRTSVLGFDTRAGRAHTCCGARQMSCCKQSLAGRKQILDSAN